MNNDTSIYRINSEMCNEGTRICSIRSEFEPNQRSNGAFIRRFPIEPAVSIYDVFVHRYAELRSAYGETEEFSYLCFVVNGRTRSFQSKAIRLEPGVFRDLVIGRHTRCDLILREDEAVSLRHALVRLYLRPSDLVPVFKVLDLMTPTALCTVDGQRTTGLIGAGHCMLTMGDYHVYLIYNNDDALPTDADQAWEAFQPAQPPQLKENAFRTFDDLVTPDQVKPRLKRVMNSLENLSGHTFSGNTAVFRIMGPQVVEDHSPGPSGTRAFLLVKSLEADLDLRIAVKETQLQRGILIGRYGRCEIGGDGLDLPKSVSRVHLILIEDEGVCWAIDAASTHGSSVASVPFSNRRMEGTTKIAVGDDTTVTWVPADEDAGAAG